jgi:hypothetical protein
VAFGFNSEETGRIERANEYDGLRSRMAFGYNADETRRIARNCEYNSFLRTAFYPLLEWGWNRARCLEYIEEKLGVVWKKSCCVFCPFACNAQNMEDLKARHIEHPGQVADALVMEHVALALNPRQALYNKKTLIEITREAGNEEAIAGFDKRLRSTAWALYRVRRIFHQGKKLRKDGKPAKGVVRRAVERLADFSSRGRAEIALQSMALEEQTLLEWKRGILYLFRRRRSKHDPLPAKEEFLVIAPATVETKSQFGIPDFNQKWEVEPVVQEGLFGGGLLDARELETTT